MSEKPRILVSYFFGPDTIPLGESCARAFEELGYEVYRFNSQVSSPLEQYFLKWVSKLLRGIGFKKADVSRNLRWGNQHHREHMLERALATFRPELLFVIRGNSFDARMLERIKGRYGVKKTIGWWVKDPRPSSKEMLNDAKSYDYYFCIHQHGYTISDNIHYLPALGVDKNLYHLIASITRRHYTHEIVFVGGWNTRRQTIVEGLLDFPIEIYGPGWRKKANRFNQALQKRILARGIWGEDLVQLYNSSKIVLNITGWDSNKLTGFNLRIFDVPACGAFLITDYSEALTEHFTLGAEIESYASLEELRRKLRYYLRHDLAREHIALAGYKKTQRLSSIADRMEHMLRIAQSKV